MNFEELQKHWEQLAQADPFGSILISSVPGQWDIDEFYATGRREAEALMAYLDALGIDIGHTQALDFGCGTGRVTEGFAPYFDSVCGIDVAPSMIELAQRHNRYPAACTYYLNEHNDLSSFEDNRFDVVYSALTLQHMQPRYALWYIREFLRVAAPGGIVIFQMPDSPKVFCPRGRFSPKGFLLSILPKKVLDLVYRKIKYYNRPRMEMYAIPQSEIVRLVKENGATVLDIVADEMGGKYWTSFRYCIRKG